MMSGDFHPKQDTRTPMNEQGNHTNLFSVSNIPTFKWRRRDIYIGEIPIHILNEERIGIGAETEFSSEFKVQNPSSRNREQLGRDFLHNSRKSGQGSRLERVGEGRRLLFRGFCRIAAATLTFLNAGEEGERGGELKGKRGGVG
ncbi:hypothetical protein KY290_031754 [Solanum tuberosum]|uniref:Uncharacterized protein n=1 Tax=Solanum tuberosum TaxID=4113 RepID=A0ABQ7UBP2_SOLTU|nr:hypothetical protein KY290_031754 [Solanum tuberosum]